ncbi:inner membrane protein OXA1 [Arthroderma uncinatum]|uniref:inner membrane protein OXA1 n=1 Tax=Arthroderma uncinatum TaxID=74035 RepID=UPI00144AE645|nr:inner membrane protein OXA1 [Arthroderma uncinatum]KAF3479494.1 inner membrane protein OXA1 [Arthroderma uncinatum]
MLVGAGVRHSSAVARAAIFKSTFAQRQFSSLNSAKNSQFRSRLIGRNDTALSAIRLARSSGPLKASSRFASTSAGTSALSGTPSDPASTPGAEDVTSGADAFSAASLSDFDLSLIPKKIGYLKELGLDYGWGPSSMVEFLLENLHIMGGLPWWGASIAAAIIIRAALFKSILSASEVSSKLQVIKPLATPIRERMLKCARESDNVGALKAKQELAVLNEQHNVKPWKAFVPLLQVPFGFGCFRVLRGMSALPVPGLDNESFLWIPTVTMGDPYYILPIATSAMMYLALKRGGDAGTSNLNNTQLGKAMLYGFPGLTLATMSFWPGILQLYFFTTGFLSMCQAYLVTSPGFRKFAGLGPLPKTTLFSSGSSEPQPPPSRIRTISTTATSVPEPEAPIQPQKISIIDRAMDGAKSAYRDTVKEAKEKMDSMSGEKSDADSAGRKPRLSKKELESAKAYEDRRKAELRAERELKNQQLRAKYLKKSEQKE